MPLRLPRARFPIGDGPPTMTAAESPSRCSPTCRRGAYEERRAAATGAIAVRVVQRETTREPSPAECVTRVLASPRACREVLNGLTTLAANGQLDTGAHTGTHTALGRLMHTLTADDTW